LVGKRGTKDEQRRNVKVEKKKPDGKRSHNAKNKIEKGKKGTKKRVPQKKSGGEKGALPKGL